MKLPFYLLTCLSRHLRLLVVLGLGALPLLHAAPPPSSFGVWDQGSKFDSAEYPFLRGSGYSQKWSELEKQPDVFDWSALDQATQKALDKNIYIFLSIDVGPDAPEWIYDHGVPKVFTDDQANLWRWKFYPYYLSPEYKKLFTRLITRFGEHIRGYSAERQERISFIQVKSGCASDETAYKGSAAEPAHQINKKSAEWRGFRLETFDLFVKTFRPTSGERKIDLVFNAIGKAEDLGPRFDFSLEWDWVVKNVPSGFGIKNGALSRGHHLSAEQSFHTKWAPYLINPKGLTLFRHSEMDLCWKNPYYQLNLPLNFYWGAVNALNGGQSIWDIEEGAIEASKRDGFDYSFHFFNRYAGQIWAATASDAFCALHKGLDSADTNAYPESVFGEAVRQNRDRMLKICALYKKYGAAVDDPEALLMDQVKQRKEQVGFNDVGWQIWSDNYGRFLNQIEADATSVGLWRIGGPISPTSSIYSRFGRAFEHATGKDAMYFKLHEGFIAGQAPQTMTFSVIWYDQVAGSSWKLVYDAGAAGMKTALAKTGTGDQNWHEATVTVPDAVLSRGGIKGSDIALINTDDKDDVFSLIEVHRGAAQVRPSGITKMK